MKQIILLTLPLVFAFACSKAREIKMPDNAQTNPFSGSEKQMSDPLVSSIQWCSPQLNEAGAIIKKLKLNQDGTVSLDILRSTDQGLIIASNHVNNGNKWSFADAKNNEYSLMFRNVEEDDLRIFSSMPDAFDLHQQPKRLLSVYLKGDAGLEKNVAETTFFPCSLFDDEVQNPSVRESSTNFFFAQTYEKITRKNNPAYLANIQFPVERSNKQELKGLWCSFSDDSEANLQIDYFKSDKQNITGAYKFEMKDGVYDITDASLQILKEFPVTKLVKSEDGFSKNYTILVDTHDNRILVKDLYFNVQKNTSSNTISYECDKLLSEGFFRFTVPNQKGLKKLFKMHKSH